MAQQDVHTNGITKTVLLKEFSQHEQSLKKMDEVPWRSLMSELVQINKEKQGQLSQLKKMLPQDDEYINEELELLRQKFVQVYDQTILEQGKQQSYLDMRKELSANNVELKMKVEDLKQLLKVVTREADQIGQMGDKALKEYVYLRNQKVHGHHLVMQESKSLKDELMQMRTHEKNGKSEVQRTYKQYMHSQQKLQQKMQQLEETNEVIKKLDYELELKRLAKLDSQMLLVELEEVKMITQVFLGQDLVDDETKEKLSNQEFWLTKGRLLVPDHIKLVTQNPKMHISELTQYLTKKCQSLTGDEFSLTNFLNMLSEFLLFAHGDVMDLVGRLLKLYEFENLYDISLKNRYDEMNDRIHAEESEIEILDEHLRKLRYQQMTQELTGNLATAIEIDMESITSSSLNLLEYRFDNSARERTRKAQRVIWRILTFLTNGVYRWVDILKSLNRLVLKTNDQLQRIIDSIEANDNELFKNQKARAQAFHRIIENTIIGPPSEELKEQKEIIFSFIKNDFILFNWGDISHVEKVLTQKGQEFQQFFQSNEVADDEAKAKNVMRGLSTFICLEIKNLAQQAFLQFQKVFTELLNRFVGIFRGVKKLDLKHHLDMNPLPSPEKTERQRSGKSSLTSSRSPSELEARSPRNKPQTTVKGLFGHPIDFKKQAVLRKCQQYQSYYDERVHVTTKKSILEAVINSINELYTAEDMAHTIQEHGNLNQMYKAKRQEIFESQSFNVELRQEREKAQQLKDKEKSKNYMEKSNRYNDFEKEMYGLVQLNRQIQQTASKNFETLKTSKSQQFSIVHSLQHTYTTFKSMRQSKRPKNFSIIPMKIGKSREQTMTERNLDRTPMDKSEKTPFDKHEKTPSYTMRTMSNLPEIDHNKTPSVKFLKLKTFSQHESPEMIILNTTRSQYFAERESERDIVSRSSRLYVPKQTKSKSKLRYELSLN